MSFKRLFVCILTLTLLMVTMAACGNVDEGTSSANTSSPENSSDSSEPSDESNNAGSGVTIHIFNSKGENAAEFEAMCKAFSEETGINVVPFSVGAGEDASEPLRAQMQGTNPPAIFPMQGLKELPEWEESGAALDLTTVTDPDFKAIVDAIPQDMRLSPDGQKSYGVPYNVEGYGYIVDPVMVDDLFGAGNGEAVIAALRTASYEDFIAFCDAVDAYISAPSAAEVTVGGSTFTFQAEKTGLAENLNGVFAFAGSEKWTYGDHLVNVALNAVLSNPLAASNITDEQFEALRNPLMAYAEALDYISTHVGALNGPATRSRDLISSTNFGYDQSVQMLADGNALFLQQGNWVASNIAKVNQEVSDRVVFIPIKMPVTDDMIVTGRTAAEFNNSIPVFVPNYYAVNAKVSEEEQAAAFKFLVWMHETENMQTYVVDSFKFIPWFKGSELTVTDSLSNSITTYVDEGMTLAAPYHGAPGAWSGDTFGLKLMEEYLIKEDWTADDYAAIAEYGISSWKNLL